MLLYTLIKINIWCFIISFLLYSNIHPLNDLKMKLITIACYNENTYDIGEQARTK